MDIYTFGWGILFWIKDICFAIMFLYLENKIEKLERDKND